MRLSGRRPRGHDGRARAPSPAPPSSRPPRSPSPRGARAGPAAAADRPAGSVSDWSHELNQEQLPALERRDGARRTAPRAGPDRSTASSRRPATNGLWFSGVERPALPAAAAVAPRRRPAGARRAQLHAPSTRATGLKWDVAVEVWAARNALNSKRRGRVRPDHRPWRGRAACRCSTRPTARAALREIRRIVPTVRNRPYVNFYTGSDEPFTVLPRGKARRDAVRPAAWPPTSGAPPATRSPTRSPGAARASPSACAGPAWSRYVGRALLRDEGRAGAPHPAARPRRRGQPQRLRLHRRLHPVGLHAPGGVRRRRRGRPLRELPGARPRRARALQPRLRRQAACPISRASGRASWCRRFNYSRYTPMRERPLDLDGPGAARRAPPTSASSRSDNPRFTRPRFYETMLAIARSRARRAAAGPADRPAPARPLRDRQRGPGAARPGRATSRYRTSGDAIYTTYSLLGELEGASFSFDADTRLVPSPARLAAARTLWMPRGDILDAAFAARVVDWVRGGRDADRRPTRTPSRDARRRRALAGGGARRPHRRAAGPAPPGVDPRGAARAPSAPARPTTCSSLPIDSARPRAFAARAGRARASWRASSTARPAAILRPVGAGRVLAFSADPMAPSVLDEPLDLARFVGAVHRVGRRHARRPRVGATACPAIPTRRACRGRARCRRRAPAPLPGPVTSP